MKVVLLLLALVPIVFAASLYDGHDDEVDKRLTISDVINHIRHLDLGDNCVQACEDNIVKFWTFMCTAACKTILGGSL